MKFLDTPAGFLLAALIFCLVIAPEAGSFVLLVALCYFGWKGLGYIGVFLQWAFEQSVMATERKEQPPKSIVFDERQQERREPTREEMYAEIIRAYAENLAFIANSPLDEETKRDAIEEEKRLLEHRIRELLR